MKKSTSSGHKPAAKKNPDHRPTRTELNQLAWQRKRQKKRRGNPPGSKANAGSSQRQPASAPVCVKNPLAGSKKPVPLISDAIIGNTIIGNSIISDTATGETAQVRRRDNQPQQAKPALPAKQELQLLENDPRLDALLDQLDAGETLSDEDQHWLDTTLARIEQLMAKLGISDDYAPAPAPQEDIMRLLKTPR